ncbi:Ref family recombination enhancement nuclease [uncultured Microbulbifer sp.]|uniref:Ref family recombination enhancement nuclease n=1 Tax=uncultured Microbulbifer sp. TaxID=348147 RepID=UPI0025F0A512|nr:Ref family recombination enhancement nuclease [uncultured Microbulbifer sp.]
MKKAESEHLDAVAALGCIVCRNLELGETPAEIHHIRSGQGRKRATHFEVIPLCPHHHRLGGYGEAFHAGPQIWQKRFGPEEVLLQQVRIELGMEVED